ncbi:MAG: thiamine pyrophosphate-binding protein, partial [Calditrichaeota bacterium]
APTTLHGTRTTTTPDGRDIMTGEPMKMAEIIAKLDGSVYVERVALFNNKQRFRAKKAIKKGLQIQLEGRGFSFIEVLAECPTHLKLNTSEAENWVKENMVPVFHLGVLKDIDKEPWFELEQPDFNPQNLVDAIGGLPEKAPRFCKSFPSHLAADDIALKFAGAGGDGAQTAALLVTRSAINEGFDSTHIPSYGPESRGGTSYADIHIAAEEVLSPASPDPHILVAFNAPSLAKFSPHVQKNGIVIYDSSVISSIPKLDSSIKLIGVPMTLIARELGNAVVKNIVALGALQEATKILPEDSFLTAIRSALHDKGDDILKLNEQAFKKGKAAAALPRS